MIDDGLEKVKKKMAGGNAVQRVHELPPVCRIMALAGFAVAERVVKMWFGPEADFLEVTFEQKPVVFP